MSNKAVDIEFLRSIIENDIGFEKELFGIFSENAYRNTIKMEEAIKSGDNNSWYMAAHAFKGASASIGAFKLAEALEEAQKNPEESAAKKQDILNKVREEFRLVLEFFNEDLLEK